MVREGPPRLAPVLVPEGPSEKIHSWERIEAQRLSAGGTAEVLPLDTNPSDPKATFTQSLRGWVDAGAVFHMRLNDYHFITHWRVRATVEEVSEILEHAEDLPRWWPSVYLDVKEIEPGVTGGIGKIVSLYTKGWLPYTLRWKFRVTDSNKPYGFALEAFGDFQGRGIWKFEQQGEWVDVEYDWKIRADKPLLRALSFALKPIFEANHR